MGGRVSFSIPRGVRARRWAWLVVLTVVVGMLTADLAGADGLGLRYRHSLDSAGAGVSSQSVDCPGGTSVVGGGVGISGTNEDLEVGETGPIGGRGWASLVNNTSGQDEIATAHAICAEHGQYERVHKVKEVPPGKTGFLEKACPRGTKVTGGGVTTDTSSILVEVADTAPFDSGDGGSTREDGWEGKVNNETSETVNMRVLAICADRGSFSYRASSKTVDAHGEATLRVGCGNDQPTGGGIDISGLDPGLEVSDTLPLDSADPNERPDDGWLGGANNESSSNRPFKVFVICSG